MDRLQAGHYQVSCRQFRGDGLFGLPEWADELIRIVILIGFAALLVVPLFLW